MVMWRSGDIDGDDDRDDIDNDVDSDGDGDESEDDNAVDLDGDEIDTIMVIILIVMIGNSVTRGGAVDNILFDQNSAQSHTHIHAAADDDTNLYDVTDPNTSPTTSA